MIVEVRLEAGAQPIEHRRLGRNRWWRQRLHDRSARHLRHACRRCGQHLGLKIIGGCVQGGGCPEEQAAAQRHRTGQRDPDRQALRRGLGRHGDTAPVRR